jgi:hemerythrin-like metal-binding protein
LDYFPWKEDYSVGVFEIDSQHRKLIAILNRLHAELWEERVTEAVKASIDEMLEYTMTHFKAEEALMARYGYPALAGHRAAHEKLAGEVLSLRMKMDQGKSVNPLELVAFLKEWLTNHILTEDKAYAPYMPD